MLLGFSVNVNVMRYNVLFVKYLSGFVKVYKNANN